MAAMKLSKISFAIGVRSSNLSVAAVECLLSPKPTSHLACLHCSLGNISQKRHASKSPFRNPDTRQIQEIINRKKQMEYLDMGSVKNKESKTNQQTFFDNVDIPPTLDTLGSILSPYVKPEGRSFLLTPQGLKQRWEAFKNFIISTYSVGLIKRHVKPFPVRQFAKAAEEMFIKTNNAVVDMDKHALRDLTTANISYHLRKTFNSPARILTWKYLRTVERPRIVQARVSPLQSKENFFAQVTVRIHTEQIFALKNRYGRLMQGSDEPTKAVEYIIFERHIVNPYGQWRICGKLFADDTSTDISSPQTTAVPATT